MRKKLSELKKDEIGIIKEIHLEEPKQFKLTHLGLLQNERIVYKFKSPFNTPLAYQINGCIFTLRKDDAEKIEVEV